MSKSNHCDTDHITLIVPIIVNKYGASTICPIPLHDVKKGSFYCLAYYLMTEDRNKQRNLPSCSHYRVVAYIVQMLYTLSRYCTHYPVLFILSRYCTHCPDTVHIVQMLYTLSKCCTHCPDVAHIVQMFYTL